MDFIKKNKLSDINKFMQKLEEHANAGEEKFVQIMARCAAKTNEEPIGEPDRFGIDAIVCITILDEECDEYGIDEPGDIMNRMMNYAANRKIHPGKNEMLATLFEKRYSSVHYFTLKTLEAAISDFRLRNDKKAKEFLKNELNLYFRPEVKMITKYKELNIHTFRSDLYVEALDNRKNLSVPAWLGLAFFIADLYGIRISGNLLPLQMLIDDQVNIWVKEAEKKKEKYIQMLKDNTEASDEIIFSGRIPDLFDYEMNNTTRRIYNAEVNTFDFSSNEVVKGDYYYPELTYVNLIPDVLQIAKIDMDNIDALDEKTRNYLFGSILVNGELLNEAQRYQHIISALMGFEELDINEDEITENKKPDNTRTTGTTENKITETEQEENTLLQELKETRIKYHNLIQKNILLNELLEKEKAITKSEESLRSELSKLKAEVIDLRKFAFEAAEEETSEDTTISEEEKIAYLKDKKIAIIGGHMNWHNKLKQLFPEWEFIHPEATGSIPTAAIDSKQVYFFTSHICHPQYLRYLNRMREARKPVGYISKVNIHDNINQIYKDMNEIE